MTGKKQSRETLDAAIKKTISELRSIFMEDFEISPPKPSHTFCSEIGVAGLVAGAFDEFRLTELIDSYCKGDFDWELTFGGIVRALVMQLFQGRRHTLFSDPESFWGMPIGALLGRNVSAEDFCPETVANCLQMLSIYGTRKLFAILSSAVAEKLQIPASSARFDCASFSCKENSPMNFMAGEYVMRPVSGESREDDDYYFDHDYDDDDERRFGLLTVKDGATSIPFLGGILNVSPKDRKKIASHVVSAWPELTQEFQDLRYLAGGGDLLDPALLKNARGNAHIIATVPKSHRLFKAIAQELAKAAMTRVYEGDSDDGCCGVWLGEHEIDGCRVKLLAVENPLKRKEKEEKLRKQAEKEIKTVLTDLDRYNAAPAGSRQEAEKFLKTLKGKCRSCLISDAKFTEIGKGKAVGGSETDAPDGGSGRRIGLELDIRADDEKIGKKAEDAGRLVIATTDCDRDWSMADLLDEYRRQNVIETFWKPSKDPRIFLDGIFIETERNRESLMWLVSVALLVFNATEIVMRRAMKREDLTLPAPDHRTMLEQPTLRRFMEYTRNLRITLATNTSDSTCNIANLSETFLRIVSAMGPSWRRYYDRATYAGHYFGKSS